MKSARVQATCSACGAEIFRTAPLYLATILRNAEEARCSKCAPGSKWHYVHGEVGRRAMERILSACSQLDISSEFLGKAQTLYNLAQQRGLVKGRNRMGLLAAALYLACRQDGLPIRGRAAAEACKVNVTELNRNYRIIRSDFGLDVPLAFPAGFLPRLREKLSISNEAIAAAKKILEAAESKGILAGKDPMGLAAAAVYIGCVLTDSWIGQKRVAKAAGVTEVTLRNRYRGIRDSLERSARTKLLDHE